MQTCVVFPPVASSHRRRHPRGLILLTGLALLLAVPAIGKGLPEYAQELKTQLAEKVMPYWYDTAVDWERGGYLLSDDASRKAAPATEKQIVTQSRMIWGFSHAHIKGFRDPKRDYLRAARNGYQFLISHFLDRENGGYYWSTDLAGRVANDRKILYGESFVIYAMVEYCRASGDKAALERALELYRVIDQRCHDTAHGGWVEHCERNWRHITKPDERAVVEVAGYRSANAHLHWMEALAELEDATHDQAVKLSLAEAVRLNATYFYPPDPGKSCFHRHPDWSPVTEPSSAGLSYGHNVEFAWLMIRAQQVLGQPPAWDHFNAILDHALKYGYDHERGGLYNRGSGDTPATDLDKVWWSQSEMLAALADGIKHKPNPAYTKALEKLLDFLVKYQINPTDGIWLDTVAADGRPKRTAKAHNWKANYHDVRGVVKFIEACGQGGTK